MTFYNCHKCQNMTLLTFMTLMKLHVSTPKFVNFCTSIKQQITGGLLKRVTFLKRGGGVQTLLTMTFQRDCTKFSGTNFLLHYLFCANYTSKRKKPKLNTHFLFLYDDIFSFHLCNQVLSTDMFVI